MYEQQKKYVKAGEKGAAQHIIEREIHRLDREREEGKERAREAKWGKIRDQQERNIIRVSPENVEH